MTRYEKHKDLRKYMTNPDNLKKYTPAYASYMNMIQRCYNESNQIYEYYGARGIEVCERWLQSFDNFLKDMGERTPGYSLERIDVNGNYEPANCKWITRGEQNKNRRKFKTRIAVKA